MGDFTTIVANDLEQITMIAGDELKLEYKLYDNKQKEIDLNGATCLLSVFKYGDPSYVIFSIEGTVDNVELNKFEVIVSGSYTQNLSGVYQQQVKIIDGTGSSHIPSQGKIIIFPSPTI